MGSESAHLPTFAPRNASTGVFWLQFHLTTVAYGVRDLQQYYPTAADASTTAAAHHAAMAIDAEQSITCHLSTDVSAASAAHSTNVNWTTLDPNFCNVRKIDIDTSKDVD